MGKNIFYAVWGNNAVGVHKEWYRVEESKFYIKGFCCKKFNSFTEAKDYAIDHFIERNCEDIRETTKSMVRLNYITFLSKILKKTYQDDSISD